MNHLILLLLGVHFLTMTRVDAAESVKLGAWLDWCRSGEDEKVLNLLWVGPDKQPTTEQLDDMRASIAKVRANPKTRVVADYGTDRVRWLAITDGTTTLDPIYMIFVETEKRWKIVSDTCRDRMPLSTRERFLFEQLFDQMEKLHRKAPLE